MTPEERNQVTDLFDRLAALEDNPRDREAERLIQDGLRHAPNAPYTLVQTALIQDEALKRADVRIRELEAQLGAGGEPPRQGGFLESMRESVFGRREAPRAGSVPTVRPGGGPMGAPPGYQAQPMSQQPMAQQPMGQPMAQPSPGGSFLGTAAAAAVGVVGGALLADSIRGMMTGHRGGGQAHAAFEPAGGGQGAPWGGSGGDGNLARDLGVNDIGRSSGSGGGAPRSQGLVDSDSNETADASATDANDANYVNDDDPSYAAGDQNDVADLEDDSDFGGDFGGDGGDGGGGSDE
jgi:uncharacterized protein